MLKCHITTEFGITKTFLQTQISCHGKLALKQHLWVDQLFSEEGLLFTYEEFIERHSCVSWRVCKGPLWCKHLNAKRLDVHKLTCLVPTETPAKKICLSHQSEIKNRSIRTMLTTLPCVILYWNRFVDDIPWKKVWLLRNRYLTSNKVKDISFKRIHKLCPAKT